jgi:hypothetical protein
VIIHPARNTATRNFIPELFDEAHLRFIKLLMYSKQTKFVPDIILPSELDMTRQNAEALVFRFSQSM